MTAWSSLVGVVIPAGGASRRMGADKLALRRDGVTLLDTVIQGVDEHLRAHHCQARVVVVGPRPESVSANADFAEVVFTRERPPGGGPLAAIAAGLERIEPGDGPDPLVVVLAGDAPAAPTALPLLLGSMDADAHGRACDAAMLIDAGGRLQVLCAAYRLHSLRDALSRLGTLDGRAMSDALAHLSVIPVPDTLDAAEDIDTPDDARRRGFTEN